jgi:hypothetical protein
MWNDHCSQRELAKLLEKREIYNLRSMKYRLFQTGVPNKLPNEVPNEPNLLFFSDENL